MSDKKYVLLKSGKIAVYVSDDEQSENSIYIRNRGDTESSKRLIDKNEIDIFSSDLNLLRATKYKSQNQTHLSNKIFIFDKDEIRDIINNQKESINNYENLKDMFYKSKNVLYKNRFKFYIPSDINDILSITTPFNQPKYIMKNIQVNDALTQSKNTTSTATIIVLDKTNDTDQISISGVCNLKSFSNIDILDNMMFKHHYKKVCSAFHEIKNEDPNEASVIFQNTYSIIPKDNF